MRCFVLSLTVALAFAGPSFAQPNTTKAATPEVIRGSSTTHPVKKAAAVANQPSVVRPPVRQAQAVLARSLLPATAPRLPLAS